VSGTFKLFKDNFDVMSSDTEYVNREDSKQLPIKFMRTYPNLKEVEGDQSFDLFNTFRAFAEFAFHYKHFSEAVPRVEAFKELIIDRAMIDGKNVKLTDTIISQFDDYVDWNIYKIRNRKSESLENLGKPYGVSMNKIINEISQFETQRQLGFNWLSSTASQIAGHTAVFVESKKGNLFTDTQRFKAEKDMISNRTNYLAFCGFFNIYPEADSHRLGLDPHDHHWVTDNHPDRIKKYLNSRNSLMFKGWQWGEESVTNVVTVAMGQNYGIERDDKGNLKFRHMRFLPKDSKSLYDGMSYDDKTGKITFTDSAGKPLSEKENEFAYREFRQAARAGIRNTVGTANDQDMARYKMHLAGKILMKFKSWMPGVVLERAREMRVNEYAQVIEEGRYRSLINSYYDIEDIKKNKAEILYASLAISRDIIVNMLGMGSFVGQNFYKLDRDKAALQFNKWKEKMREENPYELDKLEQLTENQEQQLDLFIAARQGQLIASITELRILLGLAVAVWALGAGEDDDDWRKSLLVKKAIRLTDKVRTEIGFVFAVQDHLRSIERPVSILSPIFLLFKTLTNTYDETGDSMFGEDQITKKGVSKDQKEKLYYTKQWLPGVNALSKLVSE